MKALYDLPAPAKLNLFLHITGRRDDGYHLLQSVFMLIDWCDTLHVEKRGDGQLTREDLTTPLPTDDLVLRAAKALQAFSGTSQGAHISIAKRVPAQAGMGGGSSDAATCLLALNRLWGLALPLSKLEQIGLALGADVPFFLHGAPAWAEGVGERLTPLDLPPRWYLVLAPPVGVPTRDIFTAPELTRDTEPLKMEDFSAHSPMFAGFASDEGFRNDLEPVVAARYPAVREHLEWLRQHADARMTGSGSCVFAAFDSREAAQQVLDRLPAPMQGFIAQGISQHPLRAQ